MILAGGIMEKLKLFTPIKVASVKLKNRIVFAAFESNTFTEEGFITQGSLDFYSRIAEGGAGLIITGATIINPNPKTRNDKYICDLSHDKFVPGHQKLAEAIHKAGSKALVQIVDKSSVAMVRQASDFSVAEIEQIIDYFVQGARRAKEAGFDGVNYHFAHRYTVHQFLSRASNKRGDEWGRGIKGRAKMAVETIQRTRVEVGSDFILAPRYSADEFRLWGNTLKDTQPMSQMFIDSGADMLDVSAGGQPYFVARASADKTKNQYAYFDGSGAFLGRSHPGPEYPDGANIHLAEGIRKAVNAAVPVMGAGKIRTPALAEEILQEDKADLIGIGRGLLIDPDFPKKAEEGRWDEIIKCTCCNFCHHQLKRAEITTCAGLKRKEKKGSAEAKRLNRVLESLDRSKVV